MRESRGRTATGEIAEPFSTSFYSHGLTRAWKCKTSRCSVALGKCHSTAELRIVMHYACGVRRYPARTSVCYYFSLIWLTHGSRHTFRKRSRKQNLFIYLSFFKSWARNKTWMGNILFGLSKGRKTRKKKGRVLFQTEPSLDEWSLKSKKRHFGNNPSAAVPSDSLIGWSVVMTRAEEGGNKLDRTALIFHFDEGKVIAAMKWKPSKWKEQLIIPVKGNL